MTGARPVVRRFVQRRVGDIPPDERAPLYDRLHAILCETYAGLDRARFEQMYMVPHNVLGLGYAAGGQLAGFIVVNRDEYDIEGHRFTVFTSLVLISLGFKGGPRSMSFAMRMALRYKLLHPRRSTAYVAIASTPAAYRVNARLAPRVYPAPHTNTPARIQALIEAVTHRRQLRSLGTTPCIVEHFMVPHDRSRIDTSHSLAGDETVDYYLGIAPRWAEGQCPMICVPLDFSDIGRALSRLARHRLTRKPSRRNRAPRAAPRQT